MKLNYADMFSFPNKFKLDNTNICTKILIMEQKITSNWPSNMFIFLKSNFWMFKYFAVLKDDRKLQTF